MTWRLWVSLKGYLAGLFTLCFFSWVSQFPLRGISQSSWRLPGYCWRRECCWSRNSVSKHTLSPYFFNIMLLLTTMAGAFLSETPYFTLFILLIAGGYGRGDYVWVTFFFSETLSGHFFFFLPLSSSPEVPGTHFLPLPFLRSFNMYYIPNGFLVFLTTSLR